MTYSHNVVKNNLRMASTSVTPSSTIRSKNVSKSGSGTGGGGGGGNSSGNGESRENNHRRSSPPSTPPANAHSNSIASSTNNNNHQHYAMSTTPPSCIMSTSPSSVSSSGSYFPSRRQQQRQWQQQNQRRSPQEKENGGGNYFSNNNNSKRSNGGGGGSGHKHQRDNQKSPNHVRFSPAAVILGGNNANSSVNISNGSGSGSGGGGGGNGGSARKNRGKSSPQNCGGGKMSPPTYPSPLTHFAGSKCFDAPAAHALPKPPEHWTVSKLEQKTVASSASPLSPSASALHGVFHTRSGGIIGNMLHATDAHTYGGHVVKSSKRNLLDDFDTHNLKLLLNVQS